jgi:hypothetical protein
MRHCDSLLKVLEALGVTIATEWPPNGVELSQPNKVSLCLYQTEDNGPPGLRPQYGGNYYAAFVIAPDGHNVEVVCHEPGAQ